MKFKAKEIFADYNEHNVLIVGFLGEQVYSDEQLYFMIQYSTEHDNPNQELYYIEKNDQSMGGYGGIADVLLSENKMLVLLDSQGSKMLKEVKIEIDFDCNTNEFKNLKNRLNQIFTKGEFKLIRNQT